MFVVKIPLCHPFLLSLTLLVSIYFMPEYWSFLHPFRFPFYYYTLENKRFESINLYFKEVLSLALLSSRLNFSTNISHFKYISKLIFPFLNQTKIKLFFYNDKRRSLKKEQENIYMFFSQEDTWSSKFSTSFPN